MACEQCNPGGKHESGGFTTEADYIAERSRINSLINNGVAAVESSDGFEIKFLCNVCGQHWHFSTPDWAYRGFLRRVSNASLRAAEIKDKKL